MAKRKSKPNDQVQTVEVKVGGAIQQVNRSEDDTSIDSDGVIGISVLRTCLFCYKELRSKDTPMYLAEVAPKLGIDAATLHRRLERFEEAVASRGLPGFRLFDRQRGKKAIPIETVEVESVIFNVGQIIENWDRLIGTWGHNRTIVRIGMALSAARYLMPRLTRAFPDVWFDVTQTKPQRLLDLARKKRCDLVLVEIPEPIENNTIQRTVRFPLAVLAPRGHWTETEPPLEETADATNPKALGENRYSLQELLHKMESRKESLCLLTEDPALYPLPDYPGPQQLPPKLRILRIGSTTLCHAMVMSSLRHKSPLLTISFPQFLTEDDRERLHIVPIKGWLPDPTYMTLLRPGIPIKDEKPQNPMRTQVIGEIEKHIWRELELVTGQEYLDPTLVRKFIYHATIIRSETKWIPGILWWRKHPITEENSKDASRITRNVYVLTGTHSGIVGGRSHYQYIIRGRATTNYNGQVHVVYRARLTGSAEDDDYVFNCICQTREAFEEGTFCGMWQGVFTAKDRKKGDRDFHNGSGCVVVSTEDLDVSALNHHAERYRSSLEQSIWSAKEIAIGDPLVD
jgi:DNA-binding transcriptional LysR family regulator